MSNTRAFLASSWLAVGVGTIVVAHFDMPKLFLPGVLLILLAVCTMLHLDDWSFRKRDDE
jgi:hypothetical protein